MTRAFRELSDDDVVKIRASIGASQKALAQKYNVDPSLISRIRSGTRWGRKATP